MYFRLNPECHFIKGEVYGAIFDLIDEKIYPLDLEETKIITSCEDNEPICDGKDFLKTLKDLHIGNIYNSETAAAHPRRKRRGIRGAAA